MRCREKVQLGGGGGKVPLEGRWRRSGGDGSDGGGTGGGGGGAVRAAGLGSERQGLRADGVDEGPRLPSGERSLAWGWLGEEGRGSS